MPQRVLGGRPTIRNVQVRGVASCANALRKVRARPARLALLVPLAGFSLVGCESRSESPTVGFALSDSAGVELVRNGNVGALGSSLLKVSEDLRIGVLDGPQELQFHRIAAIGLGPMGSIYVGNSGSSEVRVFTAAGDFVRAFGARGAGPGEFQRISSIFAAGEDIVIVDQQLLRATVFAADGSPPATMPLQAGASRLLPLHRAPSGWVVRVLPSIGATIPRAGISRQDTVRIAWLAAMPGEGSGQGDGPSGIRDLVKYPRVTLHGVAAGGMVGSTRALWEAQPTHAVDGQGRVFVHDGRRYVIDVIDPEGRLVRRIRRTHEPVPIVSAALDGFREKVRTFYDTSSVTYELSRALDNARLDLPIPSELPALGRMFASREGGLWVERPDLVGDPVRLEFRVDGPPETFWDIFAPSGEFMGTVELPESFGPAAVTGEQVIGVTTDELGVEYVVRYRVEGWSQGA